MSPRIRAGRPGDRGQGHAAHPPLQQWWGQARRRGSGSIGGGGGSVASVEVARPLAAKHAPAAAEPLAEGQRGRASSYARARASFLAAAQQARDMMAGLRNFMINPLAVPAPEPATYPPPLPHTQPHMALPPHHAAYAPPLGYPALHPGPLLPPQQGAPAAGDWALPAAGGSPRLALPLQGSMMPHSAYCPPMLLPPSPRAMPVPPPAVRTRLEQPQQLAQQAHGAVPAAAGPAGAISAPPAAGSSGTPPGGGSSSAAVAGMQQRLHQVQQQVLFLRQARQQGLAPPAGALPAPPPSSVAALQAPPSLPHRLAPQATRSALRPG